MTPAEPTTFELELAGGPNAATEARRWLETLPLPLSQDAYLLTHELVVNATVHTTSDRLWLILIVCPNGILVQVANEGTGRARVVERNALAESGRGLKWVEALSTSWGSDCTDATHVWFQLPTERAFDLAGTAR